MYSKKQLQEFTANARDRKLLNKRIRAINWFDKHKESIAVRIEKAAKNGDHYIVIRPVLWSFFMDMYKLKRLISEEYPKLDVYMTPLEKIVIAWK